MIYDTKRQNTSCTHANLRLGGYLLHVIVLFLPFSPTLLGDGDKGGFAVLELDSNLPLYKDEETLSATATQP